MIVGLSRRRIRRPGPAAPSGGVYNCTMVQLVTLTRQSAKLPSRWNLYPLLSNDYRIAVLNLLLNI